MHLVAYTRRGLSDVTIERAAREHSVVVRAMSRLYVEAPALSALMLGFSGYPRQIIGPAIGRLLGPLSDRQSSRPDADQRLAATS